LSSHAKLCPDSLYIIPPNGCHVSHLCNSFPIYNKRCGNLASSSEFYDLSWKITCPSGIAFIYSEPRILGQFPHTYVACTDWDTIQLVAIVDWPVKTPEAVLVSVASPTDIDDNPNLSKKPHALCCKPGTLIQHICGSDLNLKEAEPNATVLDREEGNCESNLIGRHAIDNTEFDENIVPPSLTRTTSIRFCSRVRITSGLNHLQQGRTNTLRSTRGDTGYFCHTPSSSRSGSASSSISAPLRSRTDDEADRPGWGPLGRRVSMLAKKNWTKKRFESSKDNQTPPQSDRVNGRTTSRDCEETTEASPLLMAPSCRGSDSTSCRRRRGGRCHCVERGLPSHKRISPGDVDEVFGKWPTRMLNYQVLLSVWICVLVVSLR